MANLFQNPELNAIALSLSLAAKRAPDQAEEITRKHIGEVSDIMRSVVEVDTGATRDSVSDEVEVSGGSVVGESGPTTRQAIFLEWGTSVMGPRPFAGPALDRHSADYERDIDGITRSIL